MESGVADHYEHGDLLGVIQAGVRRLGKTPETVTVDDLAPVDEFHIGGRVATEEFLAQLGLATDDRVLDVGCGFGGTSRYAATRYNCKMTGIDLTREFVETGRALSGWVGLHDRIDLHEGSALSMPFADAEFDRAFMLHVGMNIADKAGLMKEVWRVLKPNGIFGVYDVMMTGMTSDGADDLVYPVPWATTSAQCALGSEFEYEDALTRAGFEIDSQRDRSEFAASFFKEARLRVEAAKGKDGAVQPALGVHLAMGADAPTKISNMVANIEAGHVSPIEMVARKPRD